VSPPDPPPAVPHELLLGQAGFLRRLARDLVRDPHAAEDALQDTWVAALEHPPRHGGNVRAWLGTILRNLVAKRAGSQDRRTHHELRAGRDALGSSALGSNGESVRAVTDAVLALEEPYRSTILARYFDELSPSEIAKRESVPVATVKSRLRRALEMLRANLERECGSSWASGLIGLAWPGAGPHAIPIAGVGKGVFLMSLKTKLAIAGVALVVSILFYQRLTTDPGPAHDSPGGVAVLTPSPEGETKNIFSAADAPDRRMQLTPRVPAPLATTESRQDTLLYGTLLDADGKPAGAQAFLVLTDSGARGREGKLEPDGTFAFRSIPFGRYWALYGGDGFVTTEQELEVKPEQPQSRRDFTLQRARAIKVHATTPGGEALEAALMKVENRRWWAMLVPVATEARPQLWLPDVRGTSSGSRFGIGRFRDEGPRMKTLSIGGLGILELDHEPPAFASLVLYQRVLQTREIQRGDEEVNFVLSAGEVLASLATVRLRVLDRDTRAPIAAARVMLEDGLEDSRETTSDPTGLAVFEPWYPGEYQLRVTAEGHECAVQRVLAEAGTTTDAGVVALPPEAPFEAEVVGPDGSLCSGSFHVGVLDPSTNVISYWKQGCSDAFYGTDSGVLRIRGLGRRIYVLRTGSHSFFGEQDRREELVSGNVVVDLRSGTAPAGFKIRLRPASQLLIRAKDASSGGLRFRVEDEAGLEVAVGQLDRSAPRSLSESEGVYRVQLLDRAGSVLTTRTVTLASEPVTLELAR
jgi:RNA polymerase sigma-70 factor (ECF subfamily)